MTLRQRLLIVEEEFLIALDVQRTLETAFELQCVLARSFDEARQLSGQFVDFELAIVNPPRSDADLDVAAQLVAAGTAVVVSTAARTVLDGTPLEAAELVYKPFLDDQLIAACRRALAQRRAVS